MPERGSVVRMVIVRSVAADSIGGELGIAQGTQLLSVNGRQLEDFLDWEFLTEDDELLIVARTPDGAEVEFEIERPEGIPMGLELEPPSIRRCANRCDFCFVDGLPTTTRKSLDIRDDDYRLSFRHGNFATLRLFVLPASTAARYPWNSDRRSAGKAFGISRYSTG